MTNASKVDEGKVTSQEIEKVSFSTEDLRSIVDFEDVARLFAERGIVIHDAANEMGDGFTLLKDKRKLCGQPLVLVSWNFTDGDYGTFVAIRVVAKNPDNTAGKYVIIDGSRGIREQLEGYTATHGGKNGGLVAMGGLRVSEYEYEDENGKKKPAETYYIDISGAVAAEATQK